MQMWSVYANTHVSGTEICAGIHLLGDRCDCHRFFTMIDGHNSGRAITVSRWKRRLFLAAGVNNKEVSTLLDKCMNTSLARWMMGLVDEYKLNGRTLRSSFCIAGPVR